MAVSGLLLAAGAGTRMGRPKALVESADGTPWVVTASRALAAGGCDGVTVVVGAAAGEVRALLRDERVRVVVAADWDEGMGASLRAGLRALAEPDSDGGPGVDAAVVHLVDLPDVGAAVVRRLVEGATPDALARAAYGPGSVGHPVLLGRDHWPGVIEVAAGDRGARDYLRTRHVTDVDCSDLATGADVDSPRDL